MTSNANDSVTEVLRALDVDDASDDEYILIIDRVGGNIVGATKGERAPPFIVRATMSAISLETWSVRPVITQSSRREDVSGLGCRTPLSTLT